MRELFTLSLVEFDHQVVDGCTNSHHAEMQQEFLYDGYLTP